MDSDLLMVAVFSLVINSYTDAGYTCTNPDKLKPLHRNKVILNSIFHQHINVGLMVCVRECQRWKKCQSVSYIHEDGVCLLNYRTTTDPSADLQDYPGAELTDIHDWPAELAGSCMSHACSIYQYCEPLADSYRCKTTNCPTPSQVENADARFNLESAETAVGSRLDYRCHDNYVAVGEVVCQENGTWSTMTCEIHCPTPSQVENADARFNLESAETAVGSRLDYLCHDNYVAVGEVVCQENGTWSTMTCEIHCPTPSQVENADARFNLESAETAVGSRLDYRCHDNYVAVGEVVCQANGTWSTMTCEIQNPCHSGEDFYAEESTCIWRSKRDYNGAWKEVHKMCEEKGYNMIKIETQQKYDFVSSIIKTNMIYWLGLSKQNDDPVWFWTDQTEATFFKWGEDDNDINKYCVAIKGSNHLYYTRDCSVSLRLLCEIHSQQLTNSNS